MQKLKIQFSLVRFRSWNDHSQVREAFSVQQSQGLDSLMAGLDPQALDLLKVCLLDVYQLHVYSLHSNFLSFLLDFLLKTQLVYFA